MDPVQSFTLPTVLCCLCGVSIESNPTNMCVNCMKTQVDVTEGISKQLTVFWCRGCGRYQGKGHWVLAERESRDLLSLLLKKIRGINKETKTVDADFVYTEPHSMRLKVRMTIQREVYVGAILQQQFIVEYIMQNMQCPDCARSFTEHMWNTTVQVRQKVRHKKTFFFIEQLLLKHNICSKCIGIKESPSGLDFQWNSRSDGDVIIDFLRGRMPVRCQESSKLISHDEQSGTANFKFTYLVEIVPLCRDDLVLLPKPLARKLGGVNRLMVVYKMTSAIHLIDPTTLRTVEISANTYWRTPFPALQTSSQMVEYIIMDTETDDQYSGNKRERKTKFQLVDVECVKSSDFGVNDDSYQCLSHLGHLLHPGDSALAYDLATANVPELKNYTLPDVVIGRKHYPNRKNRHAKRKFKLRQLNKVKPDDNKIRTNDEKDFEQFMQDLEENPEVRGQVQLFAPDPIKKKGGGVMEEEEDEDDGFPTIAVDELLSDMANIGFSSAPPDDIKM